MWPLVDARNPFEVLIPKLKLAAERFDMVPQPHHPSCEPQPWDGTENILPGKLDAYYLQANKGPKYLVEGLVVKPMATTKESAGRFAIGSLEGSSYHTNSVLNSTMRFTDVHHALHVVDGELEITIDGSTTTLKPFETVYIPKGSDFRLRIASRYAKAYTFASGGGLLEMLCELGDTYEHSMLPEQEGQSKGDGERLSSIASTYGCHITR